MRWQDSLKTKNLIFFIIISVLFLFSMMGSFTLLKIKELPKKAENEVTLVTNEIIRELLIEEQKNEQVVLSMAVVATVDSSKAIIKNLLRASKNKEILSGSIWMDENSAKRREEALIYHFSRKNKDFIEVDDYKQKMSVFYKKMKFYSFARNLKEGEIYWTQMYMDALTQTKVISVLAPIYKNHTYIGVASLNIKFSLCENSVFSSLLNSSEKYFVLVDRSGNFVMSSSEISEKSSNNNIDSLKIPILKQLLYKKQAHKLHTNRMNRTISMLENDPIFNEASVVASYDFNHTGWRMLIAIPNHIIFFEMNELYKKIILMTILFTLLTAVLGYFFIKKSIVSPLMSISEQIQEGGTDINVMIQTKEKGEIELVVYKLNARNEALKIAHAKEVASEKLLLQQSKMAAMGEMLDAVAHQWKQPLNALSMYADLISEDYKDGIIDKKYMDDFQEDVHRQITHMTDTLSTFRSFFRPDGKMQDFKLIEVVNDVLLLAKDDLMKNSIEVNVEEKGSLQIYGSKNELRHLILNLISNAKDAFEDNNIKNRMITIRLIDDNEYKVLEVEDNAGGIPKNIIENIFKANVTSKEEGKGTGIGLYMSEQIANKHHAELSVLNQNNGACFSLSFSSN